MVTQTIQFEAPSLSQIGSGAITAVLYSGATVVGSLAGIAENGTRPGRYAGTVTDKAAATYDLIVRYNGYDVSDDGYQVALLLAEGTYVAEYASAGGGGSLTGPFTRTITVTDADTNDPIEGARVRLYRSGETETVETNASGVASFTVAAATWSYAITASGYTGVSGTVVVSANGDTAVEMEAVSVTPGTSDNTTGYLVTRTNGVATTGLIVSYQMAETPTDGVGSSYDATVYTSTSEVDGIAELTLVRGAKYWIWRGDIRRPEETEAVLIPSNAGETYQLPSHLG